MEGSEAVGKRLNSPSCVELFHTTGTMKHLATFAQGKDGSE